MRALLTTILAAALAVPTLAQAEPAAAPAQPTPAVAEAPATPRVAVVGASASAGFGCVMRETREDGAYAGSFRLIDMVRLACPELEFVSSDLASGFFFNAPVVNGAKAVDRAIAFKPDCVVGLDFLFWYCYGNDDADGKRVDGEEERLAKFERGLAELARLDVPVLVGDVPDMSRAVGRMLAKSQMPAPATLAAVNARLAEWARARPNVIVVPLAMLQRQLMEQGALEFAGRRLEGTKESPLLQRDDLHPAPLGMAGIACVVAESLKVALLDDEARAKEDCAPEPADTIARARETLRRMGIPPANAPATSPK
ncbi:MAG: hypothetical protein ACKO0W_13165 [Planctomycetota bacterium]